MNTLLLIAVVIVGSCLFISAFLYFFKGEEEIVEIVEIVESSVRRYDIDSIPAVVSGTHRVSVNLTKKFVDSIYSEHVRMYGDNAVKRVTFLGRIWRLKQKYGDVEMIYIKAIKKKPVFINKSRGKS